MAQPVRRLRFRLGQGPLYRARNPLPITEAEAPASGSLQWKRPRFARESGMALTDLVLAFTGASGVPYGVHLLDVLLRAGRSVHLTLSPAAAEVLEHEMDIRIRLDHFELTALLGEAAKQVRPGQVQYHHYRDFKAGIASGSFQTAGMAICPCSMGTI